VSTLVYTCVDSPIGELLLVGDGSTLHGLVMQDGKHPVDIDPSWERDDDAFADARRQLGEYFAGERRAFDLPVHLEGTEFQVRVWEALREIPYGTTISYGELARRVGRPAGARAVGAANGRNPVAVVVPCHRVIGADGSLTGFGGGVERKQLLLGLESEQAGMTLPL
jgi:methylated-DNA-[protein]-cysteine S-methyltransferase